MRRGILMAVVAVCVLPVALWATLEIGTRLGGAASDRPPPPENGGLPTEFQYENMPDRVGVVSSDGEVAGYVDKNLLFALTRDIPLPEGYDVKGPFPVYDEDGNRVGSYHHDRGFKDLDGDPAVDAGRGPVTTTQTG